MIDVYLLHFLAGVIGAVVYYAWARFNPNATLAQPNPKAWGAYLLADWRRFVWGLSGSIAAYVVWTVLHELGVKFTLPAALPLVGGNAFVFPAVNGMVAFLLGFAGRSFTKVLGPLGKRLGL